MVLGPFDRFFDGLMKRLVFRRRIVATCLVQLTSEATAGTFCVRDPARHKPPIAVWDFFSVLIYHFPPTPPDRPRHSRDGDFQQPPKVMPATGRNRGRLNKASRPLIRQLFRASPAATSHSSGHERVRNPVPITLIRSHGPRLLAGTSRPAERRMEHPPRRRRIAGLPEASHQFRLVNGHLQLPRLRAALGARVGKVSAVPEPGQIAA